MSFILPAEITMLCFDNILEVIVLNKYFKSLITVELLSEHIEKFGHNKQSFLLFVEAIGKYNVKELYNHESNSVRLMAYKINSLRDYKINSGFKYFQFIYQHFNTHRKCRECNQKALFPSKGCFEHYGWAFTGDLMLKGYPGCEITNKLQLLIEYDYEYKLEFSIDGKIVNAVGPDIAECLETIEELKLI